jgi:c-di-GMP-binding flagellar brake protein YcgR
MEKPDLKIGARVDIIFENELMTSKAHFMKALVYDIEENKLIISQTSPSLNKNSLNRSILVSFLTEVNGRNLRFGFPSRIIDLISDYKIVSGQNVEALILEPYRKAELVDFRTFFRVTPGLKSDISLIYDQEKVNLIDISLGGAKFTCSPKYSFKVDNKIKFKLLIDTKIFNLETIVREVRFPNEVEANSNLQHVSIEFDYSDRQLEAALGKEILKIERELLSEGKI